MGTPPKVINQEVGDYAQGNLDTVAVMQRIARAKAGDPRVRQLALRIVQEARVRSHDFLDEARAIGNFVQQNVRYVRDPNGIEQLHDPIYLIQQIVKGTAQGDCDDQALLVSTLLLSIGAQPYFAIVRYTGTSGPYNHIYTVVYDKNWTTRRRRLVLDTIVPDRGMGFEVPHTSIKEIPV